MHIVVRKLRVGRIGHGRIEACAIDAYPIAQGTCELDFGVAADTRDPPCPRELSGDEGAHDAGAHDDQFGIDVAVMEGWGSHAGGRSRQRQDGSACAAAGGGTPAAGGAETHQTGPPKAYVGGARPSATVRYMSASA